MVKEGRRRKKSQREEHRGQEKLQDSVTKVNTEHLVTSRSPAKHKGKCKRLRG